MASTVKRLSASDWTEAALAAIAADGLAAVAVEPLAKRLGVTKGSFYAHFKDRDQLIEAALAAWERAHAEAFARASESPEDPAGKLRALLEMAIAATRTDTIQGRLLLESQDPRARAALRRVTEIRLARLESLFKDLRHPPAGAAQRATLAYAVYIGLLQLAREVPERLTDEAGLVEELLRMFGPPRG